MSGPWQAAAGLGLTLAGWLLPRRVAGARRIGWAAVLDAAPLALTASVLAAASGRPVFAGAVAFALGAGFAFADRTVRETLREPVVFSVLSELPQVFTHPHLYLPFAGTGLVLGAAASAVLGGLALLVAEPAAAAPQPGVALQVAAVVAFGLRLIARSPERAARVLRRLRPGAEPLTDAARLGPFAVLAVHGIIARAERPARQARLAPVAGRTRPAPDRLVVSGRPVVVVQCEAFFDARRALPALPTDLLAGYDGCCETYGRIVVPAWGANSTRAEFAVLTGIPDDALGYDRFNPYHALTRVPIASQVWRLRRSGYRTICLHPFDRGFYRRDRAMPALGFETFLGRETLGGARTPPYMPDPELAAHILRVLDAEGPRVFIFAITMGNHGPWATRGHAPVDPLPDGCVDRALPQRAELLRYLAGLRQTDEMLRILVDGLDRRRSGAILACYGDHLPSLPRALDHLGFDDWRSDYAVWSGTGSIVRRDLAAHELGRLVADLALAPGEPAPLDSAPLDSVVREARRA